MKMSIKGQNIKNRINHNPFAISDMQAALSRVLSAITNREKIVVFGYHDLEGALCVSVFVLLLRYLNADVEFHLPNEVNSPPELNEDCIENYIKSLGTEVVITLGCNVYSHKEIKLLRENGIDIIVINDDGVKYDDEVVVSAKSTNSVQELSTPELVFKFVEEISRYFNTDAFYKYIDLLTLAIMSNNNKETEVESELVELGIKQMVSTNNYGIKALIEINNIDPVDMKGLQYLIKIIKPTINAMGRMDNAKIVVELFTTNYEFRAQQIAKYLKKESEQML